MVKSSLSVDEFVSYYNSAGPAGVRKVSGSTIRRVHQRAATLRKKGYVLESPIGQGGIPRDISKYHHRAELEVKNADILIGSDLHLWPGDLSTAFRGFKKIAEDLRPRIVVLNGDVLDFPQISRHPPIGWQKLPTVHEEVEFAQDTLHDLEQLCGRGVHKIWTLGNHDARFSTTIASRAPELAKIKGVSLSDHFPNWRAAWSCFVNNDIVIKHRLRGGIGAARANTLNAGRTTVTGHLHKLQVTGLTDYNGRRYGVDCGFMSDPQHKAFIDYTEDGPLDWAAGFAVLTIRDGKLLPPELAQVWGEDSIVFRGKVIKV